MPQGKKEESERAQLDAIINRHEESLDFKRFISEAYDLLGELPKAQHPKLVYDFIMAYSDLKSDIKKDHYHKTLENIMKGDHSDEDLEEAACFQSESGDPKLASLVRLYIEIRNKSGAEKNSKEAQPIPVPRHTAVVNEVGVKQNSKRSPLAQLPRSGAPSATSVKGGVSGDQCPLLFKELKEKLCERAGTAQSLDGAVASSESSGSDLGKGPAPI